MLRPSVLAGDTIALEPQSCQKQPVATDCFWRTAGIHHLQLTGSLIAAPKAAPGFIRHLEDGTARGSFAAPDTDQCVCCFTMMALLSR